MSKTESSKTEIIYAFYNNNKTNSVYLYIELSYKVLVDGINSRNMDLPSQLLIHDLDSEGYKLTNVFLLAPSFHCHIVPSRCEQNDMELLYVLMRG